ncbi:hypothetical protein T5B8_03786 [Salinisphaera sp. T5B8]|uniref:hypothetical protein n=1 Tax=Salinisphaera sp. T5B8 TaxID=1304154 RepID=UPI0033406D00
MNDTAASKRPGPMAILGYFLLALPAAAAPALLLGIAQSGGPQNRFEGSGGVDVFMSMLTAYGFTLLVILCAYSAFHGRARALYIANTVLAVMGLGVLVSLSWHGVI